MRPQQEEHQLTAYVGHFDDQVLAKRGLLPIFAERETLIFIGVELTKDNSSRSQLSYKLKRKIVKRLTLTGKQRERHKQKKLSRTYLLIKSFFFLFHFVASIKLVASNRW